MSCPSVTIVWPESPGRLTRRARAIPPVDNRINCLSAQFLERMARSADDLPAAFRAWNSERAAKAAMLRTAIAGVMRQEPAIKARNLRERLLEQAQASGRLYDAHGRRTVPRLRAIQLHMAAIRSRAV
jgi:hypothetical protein